MALDKKLQAKLKTASKMWGKAKNRAATETFGQTEFEDGRYIARLVSADVGESKSSGRLQVAWGYKIAEGEYKGKTKFDYEGLETEENLVWLARKLARYGYEAPDDLEGVTALLEAILKDKPLVRIRLKTRGEFQNAYLDSVFSKEDEDEALADARGEAETDTETEEEETDTETETEEEETEAEAEEDAGEDDVELSTGMKVMVTMKNGDTELGTVVEILDKEDKVRVKLDSGKVLRVAIDALSTVDDDAAAEEEEEEEEVPPAPKKKPAAAPVKKKK